jgi:predicted MFS family arabinose efflux permease
MISVYGISAAVSGLASALFLDRFDRRNAMLTLYAGFVTATLLCALSPGYFSLTLARIAAGAFGGVSGALVNALVADLIPPERRGRAMGIVMASFSLASVLGVPCGLFLAHHFGWWIPFYVLAGLGAIIWTSAWRFIPHVPAGPVRAGSALSKLGEIVADPACQRALLFIGSLNYASFLVIPYITAYLVQNVGMSEEVVPLTYLVGGLCTIFTLPMIGRWSDRTGKLQVFQIMAVISILPVLLLTNLPVVSLPLVILTLALFMICNTGRMVPAMASVSMAPVPEHRASFMSLSASLQNLSSGLASLTGGFVIQQNFNGSLSHYNTLGFLSITVLMGTLFIGSRMRAALLPA